MLNADANANGTYRRLTPTGRGLLAVNAVSLGISVFLLLCGLLGKDAQGGPMLITAWWFSIGWPAAFLTFWLNLYWAARIIWTCWTTGWGTARSDGLLWVASMVAWAAIGAAAMA